MLLEANIGLQTHAVPPLTNPLLAIDKDRYEMVCLPQRWIRLQMNDPTAVAPSILIDLLQPFRLGYPSQGVEAVVVLREQVYVGEQMIRRTQPSFDELPRRITYWRRTGMCLSKLQQGKLPRCVLVLLPRYAGILDGRPTRPFTRPK